jgi:hypothetical protein
LEGLGRNPEPFRYAQIMTTVNPELELFIQICFAIIVLCIGMIALNAWKKSDAKKGKK